MRKEKKKKKRSLCAALLCELCFVAFLCVLVVRERVCDDRYSSPACTFFYTLSTINSIPTSNFHYDMITI